MAARISRLEIQVDPDSQLPQQHPYIQALNDLQGVFGEKNLVYIGLFPKNGDAYDPAFLAKLKAITARIERLPGLVERTFSSLALPKSADIHPTADGMNVTPLLEPQPATPEEARRLRERVRANPQYVGTLVAADGSAAAIIADFDFTALLPGYAEIKAAVESAIAEEDDETFTAHLGGPAIHVAWLAHYSARMVFFFPLALAVIGLVHYRAFRTLQAMILPLVTALTAMLWSLGLLGLLGVPLDPFNVTTPILILAVAAGHAVQMLKRFYEELGRGNDVCEAVVASIERVGPVMLVAGAIASLSFLSLLSFETASIRSFGLFTALGIVSSLAIEMTLIPALRSLLPPPSARERIRESAPGLLERLVERLGPALAAGGRRPVLVVAAAVAALAAAGAARITVDSSFRRQFSASSRARADDARLNRAFAGTSTLVLLIEGARDAIGEPGLLRALRGLQDWLESQPEVGGTVSFVDFVERMHAAAHGGSPPTPLPDSRSLVAQYLLLYSMSGNIEDFDAFVDPERRTCALRVFAKEDSTRFAEALIDRLRPEIAARVPAGYRVQITGSLASSQAMNEVMVRGKVQNILQIAAIVLVISSAVLRSAIGGALVALPLALAVLVNFGIMGWAGIPLDIGTSTISAMAVGIGADYAVYFLFRLREELRENDGLAPAVERTLKTSGKAILFVSTAIAAGYLTLCFSGFGYHVRLGLLVAFAMLTSSIASLTVLPALVLELAPRFLCGRGRPAEEVRGARSEESHA